MNQGLARTSPSAERNKQPILDVLSRLFPAATEAQVLEIASGTGTHAIHFARALPHVQWQPSDPDSMSLVSITAHIEQAGLSNVNQPLELDVCIEPWPVSAASAVYCANMIHISPWAATEALFRNSGKMLAGGGRLITYGPYFQEDIESAPGNVAFDQDLRRRNPEWGIRHLSDVSALAIANGFTYPEIVSMPANNLMLIFSRT